MSIKDFEFLKKLGEGAYSVVYKVKRKSDSHVYALKQVKFSSLKDKEKENALNEIRLLASISHPNIVSYKEAFFNDTSNSLFIVMEFAESGDLLHKINSHKKNKTHFKEPEIWDILQQSLRGLRALHNMNILHRDIKSANLFLTRDGVVKIGDLNVSKVLKEQLAHTQTGTPYYASPEVWKSHGYNSKSDVWSLGCVLYEVAALNPPFRANDIEELRSKVYNGDYAPLAPEYSTELRELLRRMLNTKPALRPGASQILNLPCMQQHSSHREGLTADSDLLSTIYLPKRHGILTKILPSPRYASHRDLTTRKKLDWKSIYPEETYLNLLKLHRNSQLLHQMKSSKEIKDIQAPIFMKDYLKEFMSNRARKDYKAKRKTIAAKIKELQNYYEAAS